MPDTLTISREDLINVAADAECIFRVFTVLTGRAKNDLCLEILRRRVRLHGDDEVDVLDELPLIGRGHRRVGAAGFADVRPGLAGVVELKKLARGRGEDRNKWLYTAATRAESGLCILA